MFDKTWSPEVDKFLQEDGEILTVVPPRTREDIESPEKMEEAYDFDIMGLEKREALKDMLLLIAEWLNSPVIFDSFKNHRTERRGWEAEIDIKYKNKKDITDFLNSNKITINSISFVTSAIKTLFINDPENEVFDVQTKKELAHEIDAIFNEIKCLYRIADTVFDIKEETSNLLGIEMQPDDESLRDAIQIRILDIMHELESIACEVLEKFKKRG
jgi:hypothetical protein